jgi:serine/threonine protein kinase
MCKHNTSLTPGRWQQELKRDETKLPMFRRDVLRLSKDIASIMIEVHGKDVCHCDLKPANLLVDGEDKVRLGDFGSACRMDTALKVLPNITPR